MIDIDDTIHKVAEVLRNCGKPIGEGDVPAQLLARPFAVLDMLPSGPPEGSWQDEQDMRDLFFQVQSVGDDQRQVAWMQEAVGKAWLTYGLTVPRAVGRWVDQLGAIVRTDERTYNATDTYRLKVEDL
jgi:hypothetical protein